MAPSDTISVCTVRLGLREALTSLAGACFHRKLQYHPKLLQSLLRKTGNLNTKFAEEVVCPDFQVQGKSEAYSVLGEKLTAMHTLDLSTASQQNIQIQIHYNLFNSLMIEKWEFKRQSLSEHFYR